MRPHPQLVGWYYQRDGRHVGPFKPGDIARLVELGTLRSSDMLVEIAYAAAEGDTGVRYDYRDAAAVATSSKRSCEPDTAAMACD